MRPVTLPPQAADGSFANENKMVKEDDSLIATTFAIHVLVNRWPDNPLVHSRWLTLPVL